MSRAFGWISKSKCARRALWDNKEYGGARVDEEKKPWNAEVSEDQSRARDARAFSKMLAEAAGYGASEPFDWMLISKWSALCEPKYFVEGIKASALAGRVDLMEKIFALDKDWPSVLGGEGILEAALKGGDLRCLMALHVKGARLDAQVRTGRAGSAIMHAVLSDLRDIVAYLLDHGVSPDGVDLKESPLCEAAAMGNKKMVEMLLAKKASVDKKDMVGMPVLARAAEAFKGRASDAAAIIEALLDAGADIEEPNVDGDSPLRYCARNGLADPIAVMLASGADPWVCDADGDNILEVAIECGHEKAAMALLEACAPEKEAGWGRLAKRARVASDSMRGGMPLLVSRIEAMRQAWALEKSVKDAEGPTESGPKPRL